MGKTSLPTTLRHKTKTGRRAKVRTPSSRAVAGPSDGSGNRTAAARKLLARLQKLDAERKSLNGRAADFERQLKKMRALLDECVSRYDFSPCGSVTFTADGRIQAINLTAAKIVGKRPELLLNKRFTSFVIKSDAQKFSDHLQRCASSRAKAVSTELRITGGKAPVDVELRSMPFLHRHQKGKGHVYVTTILDMSERITMQKALQDNEQRYRSLVDLFPDAVWVHHYGRFLLANPAAVELFGVKNPGDLLGRDLVDFFRRDAKAGVEERLRRLRAGTLPMPRKEERRLDLKHASVDVEMSATEFIYDGKPAAMVIARDIGMRKRSEILMRQAEERFSKAFHASPAASSIATLGGRFIDVNRAFLRMFGFRRDEVINHDILDLNIHTHPRNRQRLVEKLRREKSISDFEITLRTKNGWPIDVMESLELVELAGETCVLTIWEDVTARRRLEKEILDISEREQSRIGQDLHDGVCQNLAGLAFLAEGLAKNLAAGRLAPEQASAEAFSLAKCVRDVIDEAHNLATGLYPVRVEENGLASGLQELATDTAQRYLIKCEFKGNETIRVPNNAVATHLYRIAQEAVSNAVKHGRGRSVEIGLAQGDGILTLIVQDDGKGLPKKNMHPGMGLKTMRYRARMIGGVLEIRPRSSPSTGTVVTCTYANE